MKSVAMDGETNHSYALALGRAFGGAVIFAFPLLMTMEMWWLGFYMEPIRLLIFMVLNIPLLVGLSHYAGFQETFDLRDDVLDALSAFAVGWIASALLLAVFGVLDLSMSVDEIIGKIALQTVPASIGAMLARKQLGARGGADEQRQWEAPYAGQVFLMAAGALFLAFNVAPTEEMVLISYTMTPWHALALIALSMAVLHTFVYRLGFRGQVDPRGCTFMQIFTRFTLVGYAVALLVSLYVLWTFGRTDGTSFDQIMMVAVVLGFPSALGAATARLIL